MSVGPVPGIEPLTSYSAVKPSTDWANPAAAAVYKPKKHVVCNETKKALDLRTSTGFNLSFCSCSQEKGTPKSFILLFFITVFSTVIYTEGGKALSR